MKKFHYSNYWGTWSRILHYENFTFIELNLTPIGGGFYGSDNSWKENENEIIRVHWTAPDKRDILCDVLPLEVIHKMMEKYPEGFTDRLINHNYLAELSAKDIITSQRISGGTPWKVLLERNSK